MKTLERMTVYLKSGNSFVLEGVMNWEVSAIGGKFNSISLEQRVDRSRLIVNTLDFGSVEAITVEPITVEPKTAEKDSTNVDA